MIFKGIPLIIEIYALFPLSSLEGGGKVRKAWSVGAAC